MSFRNDLRLNQPVKHIQGLCLFLVTFNRVLYLSPLYGCQATSWDTCICTVSRKSPQHKRTVVRIYAHLFYHHQTSSSSSLWSEIDRDPLKNDSCLRTRREHQNANDGRLYDAKMGKYISARCTEQTEITNPLTQLHFIEGTPRCAGLHCPCRSTSLLLSNQENQHGSRSQRKCGRFDNYIDIKLNKIINSHLTTQYYIMHSWWKRRFSRKPHFETLFLFIMLSLSSGLESGPRVTLCSRFLNFPFNKWKLKCFSERWLILKAGLSAADTEGRTR